jgi:hypothetical protein
VRGSIPGKEVAEYSLVNKYVHMESMGLGDGKESEIAHYLVRRLTDHV